MIFFILCSVVFNNIIPLYFSLVFIIRNFLLYDDLSVRLCQIIGTSLYINARHDWIITNNLHEIEPSTGLVRLKSQRIKECILNSNFADTILESLYLKNAFIISSMNFVGLGF